LGQVDQYLPLGCAGLDRPVCAMDGCPSVGRLVDVFGTVLWRSPAVGLIGVPLQLTAAALTLSGVVGQVSGPASLLTAPIARWEFAVGIYMVVRGIRPPIGQPG
jgi:hypothetical protein